MTIPPKARAEIDIREEVDIVRVDPTFLERQRNRYASRGVALVVLLNGVAAIALLVALAQGIPTAVKPFADAMLVFAIGAALGLTSAFFAYLSRTFQIRTPRIVDNVAETLALACRRCGDSRGRLLRSGNKYGAAICTVERKNDHPRLPRPQPQHHAPARALLAHASWHRATGTLTTGCASAWRREEPRTTAYSWSTNNAPSEVSCPAEGRGRSTCSQTRRTACQRTQRCRARHV